MADHKAVLTELMEATRAVLSALEAGQYEQLSPLLATRQEILDAMQESGFSPDRADTALIREIQEADRQMQEKAAQMRRDLMEKMKDASDQKKAVAGYGAFAEFKNP